MVQARQVYVFAHATRLGWFDGGKLVEVAFASLVRDFCETTNSQASVCFSIGSSGETISPLRDSYTHAFMLLAAAWTYRLTGDRDALELADKIVAFVEQELIDSRHGGLLITACQPSGEKRQNPLMHYLEALLALERAAPGGGYLERGGTVVELFKDQLFNEQRGILLEYFERDWSAHREIGKAGVFEPGHHFEWVWLLNEFEELSGEDLRTWRASLFDAAYRYGRADDGLIYDEVQSDFRPSKRSHRLWPHTEAIKAAAAGHPEEGSSAETFANQITDALFASFLDRPFAGGWIDHITAAREPMVDYVPASSLYHLFFAAAESAAVFGQPWRLK